MQLPLVSEASTCAFDVAVSPEAPPKEDEEVEMTTGEPADSRVSPTLLSPSLPNFNQGDSKIFLDICSGGYQTFEFSHFGAAWGRIVF